MPDQPDRADQTGRARPPTEYMSHSAERVERVCDGTEADRLVTSSPRCATLTWVTVHPRMSLAATGALIVVALLTACSTTARSVSSGQTACPSTHRRP
jgi:hypothetical protein